MMDRFRQDFRTVVIAMSVAIVASFAPALTHGVRHALFAHDAAKLGGKPPRAYASAKGVNPSRVVTVAHEGGDFTSVQAALDSIEGTESDPALVWIAPGIYEGRFEMEQHVDIQGAGRGDTRLVATGGSTLPESHVVMGSSNSAIKDVTIQNQGGAARSVGILNVDSSPLVERVIIIVNDGSELSAAVYNEQTTASPSFTDVQTRASGPDLVLGMYNNGGSTSISGSNFAASGTSPTSTAIGVHNTNFLNSFGSAMVAIDGGEVIGLRNGSVGDSAGASISDSRFTALFGETSSRGALVEGSTSTLKVRHSIFRTSSVDADAGALEVDTGATAHIGASEFDGPATKTDGSDGTRVCKFVYSFSSTISSECT